MGVRPCVTAKLPVLRPRFGTSFCSILRPLLATLLPPWLAGFAATPQGCCACVGQAVVCRASSLHLSLLRQKSEKMPIEDIHLALAPNPRVLLGFCAPSSAVSAAGGWWVAAVGFVVVLLRYRSCCSWACPGGLLGRPVFTSLVFLVFKVQKTDPSL